MVRYREGAKKGWGIDYNRVSRVIGGGVRGLGGRRAYHLIRSWLD